MAEFPALPLFTDAYMADTRHLTTIQHGAYLLMLMTAWRMPDCSLPNDDLFLSRICCLDKRTWKANKHIILSFWILNSSNKWEQGRLKDERNYVVQLRNKNAAAGRASALKRLNRYSTTVQPNVNQNPTPIPTPSKKKEKDTIVSKKKIETSLAQWEEKNCKLDSYDFSSFKTKHGIDQKQLSHLLDHFRLASEAKGYKYINWAAAFQSWNWEKEIENIKATKSSSSPSGEKWFGSNWK
jgi:uncharacterized protein YdaU (DUF1376 family)